MTPSFQASPHLRLPATPVKAHPVNAARPRRILRTLLALGGLTCLGLLTVAVVLIAFPPRYSTRWVDLKVEPTPERVARGRALVNMLCVQCHADPVSRALIGKSFPDAPAALCSAAYSANITRHREAGIGGWTDGELAYLLRTGVYPDGRLAPPWMPRLPLMADDDLVAIIAFLRSDDPSVRPVDAPTVPSTFTLLGRLLKRVAWRPLEYPDHRIVAPDISDAVAYGRYVVQGKANCFHCHSAGFATLDDVEPERSGGYLGGGTAMLDMAGSSVVSSNLTPDAETGIGNWSEDDFVHAVRDGRRPDGQIIRYPMEPYKDLTVEEVRAVYAYLKTVPMINKPAKRLPPGVVADSASRPDGHPPTDGAEGVGVSLYARYGCRSCHGENGVGVGDLRQAHRKYRTDAELEARIRHPEAFKPGTRMPAFDRTIPATEFPPLLAHVRRLGEAAARP